MTIGDPDSPLLGRVVRPADYVRVLATPMRLRSPHFAVHHLEGRPLPLKKPMARANVAQAGGMSPEVSADAGAAEGHAPVTASLSTELSTGTGEPALVCVDDSRIDAGEYPDATAIPVPGPQRWLGLVVPKRHARRAVTRTLVKRQIRNVAADCAARLAPGLWVVRQRSPFDPKQYPSAASDALKEAARAELRALFERAARGERDKSKPRSAFDGGASRGKSGKSGKSGKGKPAENAAPAASTPPPATPEGKPCAA
jgi:ribonuclease P protein component